MSEPEAAAPAARAPCTEERSADQLPAGYRQGIVTAISIFITFSLVFARFWGFEAPGEWTIPSLAAAILMFVAILLQIYTLWRSLQVRDSLLEEYGKTLKWFLASIILLLVSVIFAAITSTGVLHPQPGHRVSVPLPPPVSLPRYAG